MGESKRRAPGVPEFDEEAAREWMRAALEEARLAMEADEVPVGCVVVNGRGEITGRGRDRRQSAADPLAHAEIDAIRATAAAQRDWRLDDHTLVVTLEPCPMCAGTILMARLGRVIFGAASDKWGCAGSRMNLLDSGFPHQPDVRGGMLAAEASELLSRYFARRRG